MKRMMPAMFLSAILLSGCYDDYYFEESETTAVSQIQTTAESAEESHTEDSTDAPSIAEVTAIPPPENASEPEPQENSPEQPDEQEPSEDTPEETTGEPTTEPKFSTETTTTETTTSDETEPSEPEQTTETAISEPTTENAAESPTEPEQTDYEKALMVYEYIRENGYGTCVQYSSKTYEKCKEIGVPCQFVWTDAGIYGHVANTVCVDGIWFIMDTQAGCFLDYNYGFTEVVDKDMNHIGDADMLSNYSYSELFG